MPGLEKDLLKLFLEAVFHICPEIPNSELLIKELIDNSFSYPITNEVGFDISYIAGGGIYCYRCLYHAFFDFFEEDRDHKVLTDISTNRRGNEIVVTFAPEAKKHLLEANKGAHLQHLESFDLDRYRGMRRAW